MEDDIKFSERHPLTRYVIVGAIILIIAGFVIAVVVANSQNNPTASIKKPQTASQNQNKKIQKSTISPQTASGKPASNSAGSTSTNTSQNLSNTGPGDVIALFLGVTLISGIAHYGYRQLRKT